MNGTDKKSYNSKSIRLLNAIRNSIATEYAPRASFPSEQVLTERYQASRHTIRRVVGYLLEEGMLVREPNHRLQIAHIPATSECNSQKQGERKKYVISWVFAAEPDLYINTLTAGMNDYARDNGHELQIISSRAGHETVFEALEHFDSYCGDGLLLHTYASERYYAALRKVLAARFPVVLPGSEIDGIDVSSVSADDFNGAYYSVMRLITRFREPVYLFSNEDTPNSFRRIAAYRKAMSDAGMGKMIDSHIFSIEMDGSLPSNWTFSQIIDRITDKAKEFLTHKTFPLSVFTLNDNLASTIYRASEALGLKIGKDIRLIGFDDKPFSAILKPPLSTVRLDIHTQGYRAAEILCKRISGEFIKPIHYKIPYQFIKRESE